MDSIQSVQFLMIQFLKKSCRNTTFPFISVCVLLHAVELSAVLIPSLSCIEQDVVWGGLLYWGLRHLKLLTIHWRRRVRKVPLFHIDFAAVTEAQRKTHSKQLIYLKGCGSPLKLKLIMIELQCGHHRKLLYKTELENIKTYVTWNHKADLTFTFMFPCDIGYWFVITYVFLPLNYIIILL